MSEQTMRRRVITMLADWDAVAVENPAYPGTPDVNYVEGWLELKYLPGWPTRADTVVPVEHFTPQQRIWLKRRWRKGGSVHVLLQVGRQEWLLFSALKAAQYLGRATCEDLCQEAEAHTRTGMDEDTLKRWLRPERFQ